MIDGAKRDSSLCIASPWHTSKSKIIVASGCVGIILYVALSSLKRWVADRGKPDIRAVIFQECKGLQTYQEVKAVLDQAVPQVSRLWGQVYITAPGYKNRCYLEELSSRVILWDRNYFSSSNNQSQEAPIGQQIVEKVYQLYRNSLDSMWAIWDKNSPKKFLHFMFIIHLNVRNRNACLETLTTDGLSPCKDFFKIKQGE